MRYPVAVAAVPFLVFTLACGGVGSDGSPGSVGDAIGIVAPSPAAPEASAAAKRLCEHLSNQTSAPCTATPINGTASIDGFEVTVQRYIEWTGTGNIEWTDRTDYERHAFLATKGHAVVVEATYTNTQPVKGKIDFEAAMLDGNGDEIQDMVVNAKRYAKEAGDRDWILLWGDDQVGPSKSRPVPLTFAISPKAMEGPRDPPEDDPQAGPRRSPRSDEDLDERDRGAGPAAARAAEVIEPRVD